MEFGLEFKRAVFVPDEQVPKSPDAARQAPYNQQLGGVLFGRQSVDGEMVF